MAMVLMLFKVSLTLLKEIHTQTHPHAHTPTHTPIPHTPHPHTHTRARAYTHKTKQNKTKQNKTFDVEGFCHAQERHCCIVYLRIALNHNIEHVLFSSL